MPPQGTFDNGSFENLMDSADIVQDEIQQMNMLHELGNLAVQQGLIIGHGFRSGKYELLMRQDNHLLDPAAAIQFLHDLISAV
jgi:hypothetical protein